jgi:hypothetical protein
MIYVSIAQEEKEFAALECVVKFDLRLQPLVDDKKGDWEQRRRRLLIPSNLADPRSSFADLVAEFSRWVAKDDVTALVSQVHPMKLNPLQHEGVESLLAMLVLAFPEARWLFGTIRGYEKGTDINKDLDDFRSAHGLRKLFQAEQSALFDGAGLRDWVRQRAIEHPNTRADVPYLPRREQLAIALDEETDYAHLHAYTAYRFGFRALAISQRAAADSVLGPEADPVWSALKLKLILEDIFLNFPDGRGGLSNLGRERRKAFPKLEDAEHRILVTSDQRVPGDTERQAQNKLYIAEQKAKGKNIRLLHKPHAGIFSVWEESGLHRQLTWSGDNGFGKIHRGTGWGYVWPPEKRGGVDGSGHSSPGILLQIACSLLERAKSMLANGLSSVEDAVQGAVLANDALELLGGKTPTTAAEALSLKHQFELHAECQFSGVEYHVPLDSRLDEIERDATSIARWFNPKNQRDASLNIQMQIVNHLVRILRGYNQFDEEQVCMNRVRGLHNTLWMRQRPYRFILWPLLWYLRLLLSSFAVFVTVLGLWVVGLSLLYWWANGYSGWEQSLVDTISSFFPPGAPIEHIDDKPPPGWEHVSVACVAILSGFIHLGVFISHLYSIASRK